MISLIILIVGLILSYLGIINFLPDLYWFDSFNYDHVFIKTLFYKIAIFIVWFIPTLLLFIANQYLVSLIIKRANIASTNNPFASPILNKIKLIISTFFSQYQQSAIKLSNKIKILLFAFLTFFIARYASYYWDSVLLFINRNPFNATDPLFNHDISFYIFTLPVISQILGIVKFITFVILIYSLWQYLKRGFFELFFSPYFLFIRFHIFGILFLYSIISAVQVYLKRYDILFNDNGFFFGAGFTDSTIFLTLIKLMPLIWLVIAILALFFIRKPSIRVLVIAFALIFIPKFILNIVPSFVQRYVVTQNEFKIEKDFIKHNIEFTKIAYNLNEVNEIDVEYKRSFEPKNTSTFQSTLDNVRLWNPEPLKSTLKQLQEIRLYYEFKNIDIDRYIINGRPQQVMLSVRELDVNQISQQAQTWVNKHLIYTHGYGLCMVPVNQFTEQGLPELYIRDIPPRSFSDISIKRPEIYFGEATNHYVVSNTKEKEFDYPKDNENSWTNYQGKGGIQLDSILKRILYAIKFSDIKLLISQNIHSKSRIMYDRNIHQIPKKIAPFISFDEDPYIVVNDDGRLIWLIDGYTFSSKFPYSTPFNKRKTNYIRNSVIATIDAYSGAINFYIKDPKDPIINSYSTVYPNLFKPFSDMPENLKNHIRFPKYLFKVSSHIYNTYHMNDPRVFYNKEDIWTFPKETYDSDTGITMEPYYMYIQNEFQTSLEYKIMLPLTPAKKNNLVAILMASSEPDSFGKFTIYKFPKQETVYGPMQIESRIDQNTDISKDLTLWGQLGSRVIRGNLMVIPYDNSILYVEPIYLQATQGKLPEIKKVIVAIGDQVIMAPSIYDGINSLTESNFNISSKIASIPTKTKPKKNNLTEKIVDTYSKLKETLKEANWKAFGERFNELDELIQSLSKE